MLQRFGRNTIQNDLVTSLLESDIFYLVSDRRDGYGVTPLEPVLIITYYSKFS